MGYLRFTAATRMNGNAGGGVARLSITNLLPRTTSFFTLSSSLLSNHDLYMFEPSVHFCIFIFLDNLIISHAEYFNYEDGKLYNFESVCC